MAKCDNCKYYNRPNDPEWIRLHDPFFCIYLGDPRISHAACGNYQPSNESFLKQRIAELEAQNKDLWKEVEQRQKQVTELEDELLQKTQQKCTMTKVCHWSIDSDYAYNGTCGIVWHFPEGKPKDNDVNYCPKCGGAMVQPASENAEPPKAEDK